jgi:hypothetical protein
MNNRNAQISPQVYARIGGVIYLIIIVAGIFGELFVRGKLIVSGNATTTANNIVAHELLWRIGIATDLLMHLCDVPLMLVFYVLLSPVNKNLAMLAVLFNLVQTAVLAANKLNLLATLFLSKGADNLKGLEPHQLHSLATLYTRVHGYGFSVGLIFFGCVCLISGYLIFKSVYLPKILGVLMQIAGLCYLINSFVLIIAPKIENIIFPAILVPPFIAELSLCMWLLIKGVNLSEWNKRVNV